MKYRKEFKEEVLIRRFCSYYYTDSEIAEMYNISVATLKRWIKEYWAERNREAEGI